MWCTVKRCVSDVEDGTVFRSGGVSDNGNEGVTTVEACAPGWTYFLGADLAALLVDDRSSPAARRNAVDDPRQTVSSSLASALKPTTQREQRERSRNDVSCTHRSGILGKQRTGSSDDSALTASFSESADDCDGCSDATTDSTSDQSCPGPQNDLAASSGSYAAIADDADQNNDSTSGPYAGGVDHGIGTDAGNTPCFVESDTDSGSSAGQPTVAEGLPRVAFQPSWQSFPTPSTFEDPSEFPDFSLKKWLEKSQEGEAAETNLSAEIPVSETADSDVTCCPKPNQQDTYFPEHVIPTRGQLRPRQDKRRVSGCRLDDIDDGDSSYASDSAYEPLMIEDDDNDYGCNDDKLLLVQPSFDRHPSTRFFTAKSTAEDLTATASGTASTVNSAAAASETSLFQAPIVDHTAGNDSDDVDLSLFIYIPPKPASISSPTSPSPVIRRTTAVFASLTTMRNVNDPAISPNIRACPNIQRNGQSLSTASIASADHTEDGTDKESLYFPPLIRKSSLKKTSIVCDNGSNNNRFGSSSCNNMSSVSLTSASDTSIKRNVSFGNLEIRRYKADVSDHPSCSAGPPIQLSWEYDRDASTVVSVEDYESQITDDNDAGDDDMSLSTRSAKTATGSIASAGDSLSRQQRRRRRPHELLLSPYDRKVLLRYQSHNACTKKEIQRVMVEAEKVKKERAFTGAFMGLHLLDEAVDRASTYIQNWFGMPE